MSSSYSVTITSGIKSPFSGILTIDGGISGTYQVTDQDNNVEQSGKTFNANVSGLGDVTVLDENVSKDTNNGILSVFSSGNSDEPTIAGYINFKGNCSVLVGTEQS